MLWLTLAECRQEPRDLERRGGCVPHALPDSCPVHEVNTRDNATAPRFKRRPFNCSPIRVDIASKFSVASSGMRKSPVGSEIALLTAPQLLTEALQIYRQNSMKVSHLLPE